MCDLCETRKRVERADRIIRLLNAGEPVHDPKALAALIQELRNDLAVRHNAAVFQAQAMTSVAAIVAELAATEAGDEPEEGTTHCNPGSIN